MLPRFSHPLWALLLSLACLSACSADSQQPAGGPDAGDVSGGDAAQELPPAEDVRPVEDSQGDPHPDTTHDTTPPIEDVDPDEVADPDADVDTSADDAPPEDPRDERDLPFDADGSVDTREDADIAEDAPDDAAQDVHGTPDAEPDVAADVDASSDVDAGGDTDATPEDPCLPAPPALLDPAAFCETWHEGSLLVTSPSSPDLARLRAAQCVRGSVVVERQTDEALDLSHLRYVSGNLLIGSNTAARSLDLSGLRMIGGELRLSTGTNLESLRLDRLHSVGANVRFENLRRLRVLTFPALQRLGGSFYVGSATNPEYVEHLDAPLLHTVAGIQFLVYAQVPVRVHLPSLVVQQRGGGTLRVRSTAPASETCATSTCASDALWTDCHAACGGQSALVAPALCAIGEVDVDVSGWNALRVDLGGLTRARDVTLRATHLSVVEAFTLDALERVERTLRLQIFRSVPGRSQEIHRLPSLTAADTLDLAIGEGQRLDVPRAADVGGLTVVQSSWTDRRVSRCTDTCRETRFTLPMLTTLNRLDAGGLRMAVALDRLEEVRTFARLHAALDLDAPLWARAEHVELYRFHERTAGWIEGLAIGRLDLEDPQYRRVVVHNDGMRELRVRHTTAGPTFRELVLQDAQELDLVDISANLEVFAAPRLTRVDDLRLRLASLVQADVAALREVQALTLQNFPAARLEMPRVTSLQTLEMRYLSSGPTLTGLTHVDRLVVVGSTQPLALPALRSAGELLLTWAETPPMVFDALEEAHELRIGGEGAITARVFPALRRVTGTIMLDSARLTAFTLPAVREVGGPIYARNTRLVSLSLPLAETLFGLTLQRNASLTTLSLPAWSRASWVTIEDNAQLSTCAVRALVLPLYDPPPATGRYCIRRNANDCTDACM